MIFLLYFKSFIKTKCFEYFKEEKSNHTLQMLKLDFTKIPLIVFVSLLFLNGYIFSFGFYNKYLKNFSS